MEQANYLLHFEAPLDKLEQKFGRMTLDVVIDRMEVMGGDIDLSGSNNAIREHLKNHLWEMKNSTK